MSQLASDFVEREFKPDQAIATEGEGGLNFFVVESGTAEVSVGGKPVGTLGAWRVVRRDRARRQVGALGHRDGDVAAPRLRAPGLELPQLRRGPPAGHLEAPRATGRATPRSRVALTARTRGRGCTPRRTPSSSPGAVRASTTPGTLLVDRYARYVHAIATRVYRLAPADAEDVFQEVFARIFERLGDAP